MSNPKSNYSRKRPPAQTEEERAWAGFYQRVSNPDIAVEILRQLDSDAELKRQHLALYLCCKESLRAHKARQARNVRIGQFTRWLLHALLVAPVRTVQHWIRSGSDIAVECLPEARKEPAARQVRQIIQDAEFAQEQTAFNAKPQSPAPADIEKVA